ncbi:MAG: SDR family oxidoreductase [Verrucomicrobiota bacterium]
MKLKDKTALVTGAGTGLGRAIAIGLAREGALVALAARREDKLRETKELIEQDGGTAAVFVADVGVATDVDTLIAAVQLELGPIDLLVNNAGYFPENILTHEQSPSDWDQVIATNLRGPFLLTRAVMPGMIDRDFGRIVNISAPLKHMPQAAAYSCSKSALDALTKATAFEHRDQNILITAIEPPFCDTEMHTGGEPPEVVVPTVLDLLDPDCETRTGRIVKIEKKDG